MSNQEQAMLQVMHELKLSHSLLQQSLGALQKNRLKRAEKLTQEAVKVAERLKLWQSKLSTDEPYMAIAGAIDSLHKSVLERRDLLEQIRKTGFVDVTQLQ
jgi:hypothetical protein